MSSAWGQALCWIDEADGQDFTARPLSQFKPRSNPNKAFIGPKALGCSRTFRIY